MCHLIVSVLGTLATLGLVVLALLAWRIAKRDLNFRQFNYIFDEFEKEQASKNRGTIKSLDTHDINIIKEWVNKDRKERTRDNGMAIEETVASFEKIAIVLLQNKEIQSWLPLWFWETVLNCWHKLNVWVDYRRNAKDDKEYFLREFGSNFMKLAYRAKQIVAKKE